MSKTPEEIYQERLDEIVTGFITDHLEGGVDFLTIAEGIEEYAAYDDDLVKDVHSEVNATLDTILQRFLDSDN